MRALALAALALVAGCGARATPLTTPVATTAGTHVATPAPTTNRGAAGGVESTALEAIRQASGHFGTCQ